MKKKTVAVIVTTKKISIAMANRFV